MGSDQYWSLDDRLKYLFHTGQMESEEFLSLLKFYGRERIGRTYLEYKNQGSSYVPKSPTGQIHPTPNPVQPEQVEKAKASAIIKQSQTPPKKTYSRFHAPDDDL